MKQTGRIKTDIVRQLQDQVLALQGFKKGTGKYSWDTGLSALEKSFPDSTFPTGVHEFFSYRTEDAASTSAFICGLLSNLLREQKTCLWIGAGQTIFPSALPLFGLAPERIIFIKAGNRKDALWTIEEALRCEGLNAVIGEIKELSFTESRRLQLAVEQSRVNGFIHRYNPKTENTTACVTRWKIQPLPGNSIEGLPGIGRPVWKVQLVKVRNGKPGSWQIQWSAEGFQQIQRPPISISVHDHRKTG